jgi:hypothetical protein
MSHQKSLRITASATAVTTGRGRLISIHWVGAAGAGRLTFSDGNGGTTLVDIDTPAGVTASGQVYIGEDQGVTFRASIYCTTMTAGFCTAFFEPGA